MGKGPIKSQPPALLPIWQRAREQNVTKVIAKLSALNAALRSDKLATERACAATILKNKDVGRDAVAERDQLKNEFEEYKAARELQITTCQEGMEKLQAEVDALKADMGSFEKRATEAESALNEQKEKNVTLKKECDHVTGRLCTALGSAESSKQNTEKVVATLREKDLEIATLQEHVASLAAQKELHDAEKSTSSSSNRALQDQIVELSATNAGFAKENEMLLIKVRQLDEQCERLSDKHHNEMTDKENIILDLQAEVDRCKDTAFTLGEHIETQQSMIQELETENDDLHDERNELRESIARLSV